MELNTTREETEETGSALKEKPSGRVLSVRIPENIDVVW
jgi:hypothetical protein